MKYYITTKNYGWLVRGDKKTGQAGYLVITKGRDKSCQFIEKHKGKSFFLYTAKGKTRFECRTSQGEITYCQEQECCRGMIRKIHAQASPLAKYSQLSIGGDGNKFLKVKNENGIISLETLILALITSPEKPEYIRENLLDAYNYHPDSKVFFKDYDDDANSPFYGYSGYDVFFEVHEQFISMCIKKGGSGAAREIANLLEKIEKKERNLDGEEEALLKAINKAGLAAHGIPTQKSVKELWFQSRVNRTEEGWKRTRDRLGFKWLPSANNKPDPLW